MAKTTNKRQPVKAKFTDNKSLPITGDKFSDSVPTQRTRFSPPTDANDQRPQTYCNVVYFYAQGVLIAKELSGRIITFGYDEGTELTVGHENPSQDPCTIVADIIAKHYSETQELYGKDARYHISTLTIVADELDSEEETEERDKDIARRFTEACTAKYMATGKTTHVWLPKHHITFLTSKEVPNNRATLLLMVQAIAADTKEEIFTEADIAVIMAEKKRLDQEYRARREAQNVSHRDALRPRLRQPITA